MKSMEKVRSQVLGTHFLHISMKLKSWKFKTSKGTGIIKKITGLLEEKEFIRFQYIKELSDSLYIKKACKPLNVSRSGYYKYLKRKPSERDIENEVLSNEIKNIFDEHKGGFGSLHISKVLKQNGIHINRKRASRLMR